MKNIWLGLTPYLAAYEVQLQTAESVRKGAETAVVLACEHPAVITLGKRAKADQDLIWPIQKISEKKVEIQESDRGGQATLHSPGQLVLYPILSLSHFGLSVRTYVDWLERCTVIFLEELGIKAERLGSEPGLWIDGRKIAAFGVRVDRGVTMHGAAINIKNDLSLFQAIRVCGTRARVTSVEQVSPQELEMKGLAQMWCQIGLRIIV